MKEVEKVADTIRRSQRSVFREEIRDIIRDAIFDGTLRPGDRVAETYWAKEIGVSNAPVREAIRDLEAMGLVETVPFKGTKVKVLTKKDIQDSYGVRISLESKSIHDTISTLSDEALASLADELKSTLKQMEHYAEKADLRRFTDCDTAFHRLIILATENQVLLKLWEQCNMRNWFLVSALTDAASLQALQMEHRKIAEAIAVRDEGKAKESLEVHLTNLMNGFICESDND